MCYDSSELEVYMKEYLPDMYQKSIYTIDYSKLLSKGIKCILYDLDNTIVASKSSQPTEKAKDLFTGLKQKGFKIIIFTNSPKFRLKTFTEYFGVDGVSSAGKPFTRKLKKLLFKYNYKPSEVAIIGDQLMTDVKVGKKVGITTILINPISDDEIIFTKFNRFFENKKFKELENNNLLYKDSYYE